MSNLKIVTYPDQFLAKPTEPLDNIDQEVQEMIDKMTTTMYEAPGIGLGMLRKAHCWIVADRLGRLKR